MAINQEGKKLGLKRGMPFFQAKEIIKNKKQLYFQVIITCAATCRRAA
ncbi:TPA: hypothetical protein ACHTGR_003399 [Serratia marcescens subsp. marcescens ATCC 13880]|nr:hypothetical protein [Serratia marcescens]